MKKIILIVISSILLTGCPSLSFEQTKVKKVYLKKPATDALAIASYPTELRGAYFKNGIYCAEPFPDVGVSRQIHIGLPNIGTAGSSSTIAELAGRDSVVLVAREMLYRICEMGINYPDESASRTVGLFEKAIAVIQTLARGTRNREVQVGEAKVIVLEAEAKAEAIVLEAEEKASEAKEKASEAKEKILEAKEKVLEAEKEAKRKVLEAEEETKRKVLEAEEETKRKVLEAEKEAERKVLEAEAEAERKVLEAEAEAERKVLEAEAEAKEKTSDAEARVLQLQKQLRDR